MYARLLDATNIWLLKPKSKIGWVDINMILTDIWTHLLVLVLLSCSETKHALFIYHQPLLAAICSSKRSDSYPNIYIILGYQSNLPDESGEDKSAN